MRKKNIVLKRQARKMIYDVNCFLKKEADECIDSLKQIRSQIEEVASLLSQSENNQTIQTMQVMKTETVSKLNCVVSKLAKIQKRTSEATKTSIGTVKNIANQAKSSDLLIIFRTPGKNVPELNQLRILIILTKVL